MKKLGSILFSLVALALIVGAIVLVVKLVKGALNTILGILVIIALVVIVIWMFSYANRMRKK
ncbi:MAG: hypothetical protein IKD61_02445 [Oscillospiraceae bacterium]|nr:hypothetical protein [Oscillospiraceae bacterium]